MRAFLWVSVVVTLVIMLACVVLLFARFVALQARCQAFVCGDTGPLHTSVAAGTPTLGLISRNRPAMFFPYAETDGHRAYYARAECSPCHRDDCPLYEEPECLKRTGVDEVVEASLKFLDVGDST